MIVGFCCLYGTPSRFGLLGGTGGELVPAQEVVEPGAFARSLHLGRQYACVNHDPKRRLGSTEDGRLRLRDAGVGVRFELDARLPRGFSGVSFGFRPLRWRRVGLLYRLMEAELIEVTLVTAPHEGAYRGLEHTTREV